MKVILVSFFTEGYPHDYGLDLKKEKIKFETIGNRYFDKVLIYSPRDLLQKNKLWEKLLYNQDYLNKHIKFSKENPNSININWAKLNGLLWKPALLKMVLEDKTIRENDIVVYSDINVSRYQNYLKNLEILPKLVKRKLKKKSIMLCQDSFRRLASDHKEELLYKYLGIQGNFHRGFWAGCIGFKKDNIARTFSKIWYELSLIEENRSQITRYMNKKYFRWHSQEQATLSVLSFLWLSNKNRRFILKVNAFRRLIRPNWPIRNYIIFCGSFINFYCNKNLLFALLERIKLNFNLKKFRNSKNFIN
ncbi:hypothetical protein [uncultured Prochlorococcus sp.]|uniref:hypothetical protein n=1 Tax=uncultured Prochlorococcus sp. TaxID=159733 RepID=UPI002587DA89|nr:hypothetical protein [uncultured Prochlorococcus sp.]